jgi:hypothetical protein
MKSLRDFIDALSLGPQGPTPWWKGTVRDPKQIEPLFENSRVEVVQIQSTSMRQ